VSTTPSLARSERAQLADLLDELGPDAPTCCEGWDTAHLAAHLVVRDRRPDAMPGFALERFAPLPARWSHRVEDRLRASTPYAEVVARVRTGPPAWSPLSWPAVDSALNATEYVIHHEDVRRARPGWEPRALPRGVQDVLWKAVLLFARPAAAARRGSLLLRRGDAPGVERRLGTGEPVTTVTGEPLELLLWLSGRERVARVEVESPGDASRARATPPD
jgi:uncharacterized protein (TIGR03085 family)